MRLAISEPGGVVILAPSPKFVPDKFYNCVVDNRRYSSLLGAMQRLRGRNYLADGAIEPSSRIFQ